VPAPHTLTPAQLPADFGRYRLLEVLGQGGMAKVFLAELQGPAGFRKQVAVKVLVPWEGGGPDSPDGLFLREARVGGLLRHPNIVDVYELGEQAGALYFAMEVVRGPTLRQFVRARGALSPRATLELGLQLCSALSYAHALLVDGEWAGLVHRDIKPANILLTPEGLAKISDFGIAQVPAWVREPSGRFQGTPAYASPEKLDALPPATPLEPWLHHLRYQTAFAENTLSEDAERAIARKDLTGKSAWVNLYTQVTGGITFDVGEHGTGLTRAELGAFAESTDRAVRRQARDALAAGFEPHRSVIGFVFNTLFEDHRLDHAERGYDDVTGYPLKRDELSPAIVHALLDGAAERYPLMHRLHAVRSKALGLDDYASWDFSAPAFGEQPKMGWDEACEVVTAAFDAFDPDVGQWARDYLDSGRVDAPPRAGKTSGGFCSPGMPPDEPFLLLNHTDRMDDVFTLAHELGHALHFHDAGVCRPLNYWPGTALAETASNFGEMLLHEELMRRWTEPDRRRQLLHRFVRDGCNSALLQSAHVRFERAAHAERATGVVAGARFSELWVEEMSALFGGVQTAENEAWRWATIPHFVFARFYCYSYAFGRLLTYALHRSWRTQGDAFVPRYRALLAGGGSQAPVEALRPFGITLDDPDFWSSAFEPLEAAVAELEELV
jgi:oligoendopeptidase F